MNTYLRMQENSTPPISQGKSPLFTTIVLGVVSLLALTGMIAFIYFTFFKNSNSLYRIQSLNIAQ